MVPRGVQVRVGDRQSCGCGWRRVGGRVGGDVVKSEEEGEELGEGERGAGGCRERMWLLVVSWVVEECESML